MMIKGKFPFKRWWLKVLLNSISFILIIIILTFSKLPEKFDSYIFYKDFKFEAWAWLLAYRFSIYFIYPFIVSFIEMFIINRKTIPFIYRLLENFNVQFFTYTLISAIYALLGVDKILGVAIFSSSDSFMFIGSFIFTLLLNKSIPNLFYNNIADDVSYDRRIYEKVDLATIKHDSNLFSNSRNFLDYEYNNITNGKHLIVILKNPSKSFVNGVEPSKVTNCIDITTYNVMKTIDEYNQLNQSNAYKKVTILNLFPEFSTEPETINKIYGFESRKSNFSKTRCYRKMHSLIDKMSTLDCDVLFAWGQNDGIYKGSYDLAIEDMKSHFKTNKKLEYKEMKIVDWTSSYPSHGLIWRGISNNSN